MIVFNIVLICLHGFLHLGLKFLFHFFELLFKLLLHQLRILNCFDTVIYGSMPDAFIDQSIAKRAQVTEVEILGVFLVKHVDVCLSFTWLIAELADFGMIHVEVRLHA